jgi:hypothetical protein
MKDHLLNNGQLIPWTFGEAPLPPNSDGRLVERVPDPVPELEAGQVAEPGEVFFDPQAGVSRQRWVVRTLTTDELRRTWDASDFVRRVESIAPGSWDRLDAAIDSSDLPAPVRSQLRMARRLVETSQHVISDDPETVAFLAGVVAIGPLLPSPILTQEQAEAILAGP